MNVIPNIIVQYIIAIQKIFFHPHGIRILNDLAQADTASPKDSKSKNNSPRGSES